jgi:hypothetical protein
VKTKEKTTLHTMDRHARTGHFRPHPSLRLSTTSPSPQTVIDFIHSFVRQIGFAPAACQFKFELRQG